MLFATKTKGYIVDRGEETTLIARVSSLQAPLVIEELREVATADSQAWTEVLAQMLPKKRSGYAYANCGIAPASRFVRKATLDLKRGKETEYLAEVVNTQFRLDPDKHTISVLNSGDGTEFDASRSGASKDVVFAGILTADIGIAQSDFLKSGLFPARLELSSLSMLGAALDYLKFNDLLKPTLILELGAKQTQSYIISARGIETTRPIAVGLDGMVPVVQKELGLKDEESARKLFFSNTFDFTGMGASLCKRLLKELQSSMGFYEVQTGQSISQLLCPVLPTKLNWLEGVIANQIGVNVIQPEFGTWLGFRHISLGADLTPASFDARKLALLGLMASYNAHHSHAVAA
jgi:hypothetical protein